jgi:REP element-mobilizing transposase RayT
VHAPDRVKTWSACPDHIHFLSEYLDNRSFLLGMRPLDADSMAGEPA